MGLYPNDHEPDLDTATPTPPTRVMARRIDETTTMDPSEIVTLVLAQQSGELRAAARRAGLGPPTALERLLTTLGGWLQTVAVVIWTAVEPLVDRAGARLAPALRSLQRTVDPWVGPRLEATHRTWNRRVAPRVARTAAAIRRECERVWAGLAPARARTVELRPTDQTIDLLALTLIAAACGLAVLAVGVWIETRLGATLAVIVAGLALGAEAWAGRRLSRRGVRDWTAPGLPRRGAGRERRSGYRSTTTSSVSRRGSRQ
jgi:hypothetical protein